MDAAAKVEAVARAIYESGRSENYRARQWMNLDPSRKDDYRARAQVVLQVVERLS